MFQSFFAIVMTVFKDLVLKVEDSEATVDRLQN